MLSRRLAAGALPNSRIDAPARQGGVVLLIALIILVALSLGGIALLRSVDTTNIIAGNLAFQQASTSSGENGTEAAIVAIRGASTVDLEQDHLGNSPAGWAYAASAAATGVAATDPATAAEWDAYWTATINPHPVSLPVAEKVCKERVCTLPTDPVGNTVSYTIQRLCEQTGPTGTAKCIPSPEVFAKLGNSLDSGKLPLPMKTQIYYRITTRIAGPRNTVSYIQTIVAN